MRRVNLAEPLLAPSFISIEEIILGLHLSCLLWQCEVCPPVNVSIMEHPKHVCVRHLRCILLGRFRPHLKIKFILILFA